MDAGLVYLGGEDWIGLRGMVATEVASREGRGQARSPGGVQSGAAAASEAKVADNRRGSAPGAGLTRRFYGSRIVIG
jgi:hypothetical protein